MYDYERIQYLDDSRRKDFEIFLDKYLKLVLSTEVIKLANNEKTTPHAMLIDILLQEIEDRRTEDAQAKLGV